MKRNTSTPSPAALSPVASRTAARSTPTGAHHAPPTPPPQRAIVVATDLDRTFTKGDLSPSPQALRRARELRSHGHRVVLVTGRRLADRPVKDLQASFDALVLEGGAVWGRPGQWSFPPVPASFWAAAEAVREAGHDVDEGWASFSLPVGGGRALTGLPGLRMHVNQDRIDVTPDGHDKGTGLKAALDFLGLGDAWVLGVGDGANDVPLARAAHASVAVANADPGLVAAASLHAPFPAHRGFLWAVSNLDPRAEPSSWLEP